MLCSEMVFIGCSFLLVYAGVAKVTLHLVFFLIHHNYIGGQTFILFLFIDSDNMSDNVINLRYVIDYLGASEPK